MSTIARQRKPVEIPAADRAPAPTRVLVRWAIPAEAIARPPFPLNNPDPDAVARLEWSIRINERGHASAAASLHLADRSATLAPETEATVAHDSLGFTHLIIPGLLSVVIDDRAEPRRLLYAATPLLARLGVPGGRTDPPVMG